MEKDDTNKVEINVHDGGQVNFAKDNGYINVVQNNKNNQGEKKIYLDKIKNRVSKKIIILTVLLSGIVIFSLLFTIHYVRLFFLYNNYIDTANYLKENHDNLQAAEVYHDAVETANKIIFNREFYVNAACMEADCYFLLALEEDDENISSQYYAKAGGKYGEIINNKKNKRTDCYVDALTGLCWVYDFTEHKLDEEWKMIIKQIDQEIQNRKKEYENILNSDNVDDSILYRWMRIYYALGEYYYTAIKADYSFMYNPYITSTALSCYEKYDVLLDLAREKDIEVATLIEPIYYDKIRVELMIFIALSPWTKDPEQYAKQAIDICQSYLNNASLNIGKDVESYICFKAFTASGYRVLGEYTGKKGLKEEADEYMKKAYDELIVLLDLKSDEIQIEQIVNVGYSAIFTGFCSSKDLEKILDNYDELLLKYNFSEQPKELAWFALNICDACRGIIDVYGYSERAWKIGKELTETIMSIEEYIQMSQKGNFNEIYDFFH